MSKPTLHQELGSMYRELVGFLRRRLRNDEEAADLAHDAMVRVLASRTEIDTPRAFVFRAARNLLVDRHRTRKEFVSLAEEHAPQVVAPGSAPDTAVHHRQLTNRLSLAIEALPPRCREVFVLHKIHGLTHSEVARRCGISMNMVERHVMRGLVACREAVRDAEMAP